MNMENLEADFKAYQPEDDREKQAKEMGLPVNASWPEIRKAQLNRVVTGEKSNFGIGSRKSQEESHKSGRKVNPDFNN